MWKHQRIVFWLCVAAFAAALAFAVAGCGSVHPHHALAAPTSSAFRHAEARVQGKFNGCLKHAHVTSKAGRQAFASCMGLTGANAGKFKSCVEQQVLNIGTEMLTPEGRHLFHNAALDCAAQFS